MKVNRAKEQALTHERLTGLLYYDPETGVFVWRQSRGTKKAGSFAGYIVDGYMMVKIDKREYYAHRLAWFWVHGQWPPDEIDHANNARDDNRLCNLRLASGIQNTANAQRRSDNRSGYKGVGWHKHKKRWCARIKQRTIGYFADPIAAAKAYDAKARELFGEFAHLNFPEVAA